MRNLHDGWAQPPGTKQDQWDDQFARGLLGKTVLVGMTIIDMEGGVVDRQQFFGVVDQADPENGIALTLGGANAGETYMLPPDLSSITAAPEGIYNLRNGDQVTNPDFTSIWEIHKPGADQ